MGTILFILALTRPSLAITLPAEVECREQLWSSRAGRLVSMQVQHPQVGRTFLTGVLSGVRDDQLDFDTFRVPAVAVIEPSVKMPAPGDVFSVQHADVAGTVGAVVGIFEKVEGGLLYGTDYSVPVAELIGPLTIITPGSPVFVEYYRPKTPGVPLDDARQRYMAFEEFEGVDGKVLRFTGGLRLPLSHVTQLKITRP